MNHALAFSKRKMRGSRQLDLLKLIMSLPAVIIPARMASTRFPGKPLADLAGKPMIQWVYEAVLRAEPGIRVVIAAPDPEIVKAASQFGCEAVMTSMDHPSGTDRAAEAAEKLGLDKIVNVQGDEPMISPVSIRTCLELLSQPETDVCSLYDECPADCLDNPAVVKVVTDHSGNALYFSRYCIPFERSARTEPVKRHIGIYGYSASALKAFVSWSRGPLETSESLEQIRFLEHGWKIRMGQGESGHSGIDTPEQMESLRALLASKIS